jgi:myo-inositol-1(or 4)-monophosphatase
VTLELPARRIYYAMRGAGAHQRDPGGQERRLHVNRAPTLETALLSTGFPYIRPERAGNDLAELAYFLARAQGVRCMGAAALDLAFVAAGHLAAYWETGLKPWDAAAGALLVAEAGGQVSDHSGAPWTLRQPAMVASNGQPSLHQALITGIRTARASLAPTLPADA